MLLVHPVRELLKFLPALLALVVAGTASGGGLWQAGFVVVPVALGIVRYLTTRYRVADGRVELSRGLLNRRVSSTPLDRVRSVDLTSSLLHRLLGLTTMRIGTGQAASDDESLDLDGLPADRARDLRASLLRSGEGAADPDHGSGPGAARAAAPVAVFDLRWLRFAPFTGTGLVVVAAVLGASSQLLEAFDPWERLDPESLPVPSAVGVVLLVLGLAVVMLAISVVGYLVMNGGYRLTRRDGSWHVQRGLLTTRETSIDEDRIAGVAIGEPLALRLAGARHLQAIATGVKRSEAGSSMLVPPSDADVAPRVARSVVGADGPVEAPLVGHGPMAARRRWVRAMVPAGVLAVAAVVVAAVETWWALVPAAVLLAGAAVLATDRVRGLGHALVDGHVVARSGSLARKREVLDVGHVIGWTFRDTWFQRRAGLTTLVATTAGGSGSVTVLDVPGDEAVGLATRATPGLVTAFHG